MIFDLRIFDLHWININDNPINLCANDHIGITNGQINPL